MGRLGGRHTCRTLPKCHCLLPEQGPFHACCGYYCLKCKGNMNDRKGPSKKVRIE